jgi:hypothetical protein
MRTTDHSPQAYAPQAHAPQAYVPQAYTPYASPYTSNVLNSSSTTGGGKGAVYQTAQPACTSGSSDGVVGSVQLPNLQEESRTHITETGGNMTRAHVPNNGDEVSPSQTFALPHQLPLPLGIAAAIVPPPERLLYWRLSQSFRPKALKICHALLAIARCQNGLIASMPGLFKIQLFETTY